MTVSTSPLKFSSKDKSEAKMVGARGFEPRTSCAQVLVARSALSIWRAAIRPLQPATHFPHTAERIWVRRLDAGSDRRALFHRHLGPLRSPFRRCRACGCRAAGWAHAVQGSTRSRRKELAGTAMSPDFDYGGSPMRRSRSWKRGSECRLSKIGSLLTGWSSGSSCSSTAFLRRASDVSLSPRPR